MPLFRQVLLEKNGKALKLTNFNWDNLVRILTNSAYNTVSLNKDRILYFDENNPSKYEDYDLHVLKDSEETFDEIILFQLESSRIEESVRRKQYLVRNMFIEVVKTESTTEKSSSIINEHQSIIDQIDPALIQLSQIECHSPMNSNEDPDRSLFSMENIKKISPDHFIDKLEDDDKSIEKSDYPQPIVDISFDFNEKQQLLFFVQMMLKNQQLILEKVSEFQC